MLFVEIIHNWECSKTKSSFFFALGGSDSPEVTTSLPFALCALVDVYIQWDAQSICAFTSSVAHPRTRQWQQPLCFEWRVFGISSFTVHVIHSVGTRVHQKQS